MGRVFNYKLPITNYQLAPSFLAVVDHGANLSSEFLPHTAYDWILFSTAAGASIARASVCSSRYSRLRRPSWKNLHSDGATGRATGGCGGDAAGIVGE